MSISKTNPNMVRKPKIESRISLESTYNTAKNKNACRLTYGKLNYALIEGKESFREAVIRHRESLGLDTIGA